MGRAENVPLGDNQQSAEKGYHDVAIAGFLWLMRIRICPCVP